MESEIITAQDLSKLEPIECPQRGGVNYPCAPCQQCPIGEVTMTFGEAGTHPYVVENTVNSVLIHLELPIQDDPLEKATLQSLKENLSSRIAAIQKGDWETGDISILLTNDMVKDQQLVDDVTKFLHEFPRDVRQLMISAKRTFKNWSEKQGTQLGHKYFRLTQK